GYAIADENGETHEIKKYSKNFSWDSVIKKDIDECIKKSKDFDDFIKHLKEDFNYRIDIKNRKYISVKAPGMKKSRRLKEGTSLGKEYSEAAIRERIEIENGRYNYKRVNPPNVEKIKRMPKQQYMGFVKWDNMTPFQRERLKAVMIRKQLCRTNGPLWYKKVKSNEFNKTVENYQYIIKWGLKSEEDAIKRYYDIYNEALISTKKRYCIRQEIRKLSNEAAKMEKNTEAYSKLIEQIKAAAEEAEKCNENIKNLRYEKYRCKRLLSEDVVEIIKRHDDIMYKNWKLEKDIKALEEEIEDMRKEKAENMQGKQQKNSKKGSKVYTKETGRLNITITTQLIADQNDHAIKTRVPKTWGKNVRYLWTDKSDITEIHEGKTIFTFLESNKEYQLYSEDGIVIETVKGEDLYSEHYDTVSENVSRYAYKERKEQVKRQ
ncbi:MAG: hypothetical protein NC242_12850, partial [Roseburia sp.]|nr:hypothetical protein [Roseburia sp.]